jgi:hypothetical protein
LNPAIDSSILAANQSFWSRYAEQAGQDRLLVVEYAATESLKAHVNSIFSLIARQAKGLRPVLLNATPANLELLRSYVPDAEAAPTVEAARNPRILNMLHAVALFLWCLFTRRVISLRFDGVQYGDIIYDTYLKANSVATIRKFDRRLLDRIHSCITTYRNARVRLIAGGYNAIMISHMIGEYSAIYLRAALALGIPVFVRGSNHRATFQRFTRLEEVVYQHRPNREELQQVLSA